MRYLLLVCGLLLPAQTMRAVEDRRPNVILIMADDIGFECFSSYGSREYSTPRLDKLAADGIRFLNCHSTPLCTPSRVNLMSGKSNVYNYTDFGAYPKGEPTFANHFKKFGYAIGGKWQLQGGRATRGVMPTEAGFDTYCLWNIPGTTRERFWNPSLLQNGKLLDLPENAYGPDVMTDFLIDFIKTHKEQPFLTYYPMILVHNPFPPTPDSAGTDHVDNAKRSYEANKRNFIAMVNYMDKCYSVHNRII